MKVDLVIFTILHSLLGLSYQSGHRDTALTNDMVGGDEASSALNAAALARKQALARPSGPAGLVQNAKVFGIAVFACLGGYEFY